MITVDTVIPVNGGVPVMARQNSEDNSWWIPIVEKAIAKIAGNYERLALGWMAEAMRIVCGAPSYRYDHSQLSDT